MSGDLADMKALIGLVAGGATLDERQAEQGFNIIITSPETTTRGLDEGRRLAGR